MSVNIDQISNQLLHTFSIQKNIAKGVAEPTFLGNGNAVSFSDALVKAVRDVNQQQVQSAAKMQAVDMGKSDDLIGTLVAQQKASLSFSALIQIRNRLVQAFDDVIKMPV